MSNTSLNRILRFREEREKMKAYASAYFTFFEVNSCPI